MVTSELLTEVIGIECNFVSINNNEIYFDTRYLKIKEMPVNVSKFTNIVDNNSLANRLSINLDTFIRLSKYHFMELDWDIQSSTRSVHIHKWDEKLKKYLPSRITGFDETILQDIVQTFPSFVHGRDGWQASDLKAINWIFEQVKK